jgi:HEAT repeat protein
MPPFGPPDVEKLKAQEDIPGLIEALEYGRDSKGLEAQHVRVSAAVALGQIPDARAVEPLIAVLREPNEYVRLAAVEALGLIGDPRAVEPLVGLLKHRSWQTGHAAARALGQLGDVRAVEPLVAALGDPRVLCEAAPALRRLGWQPDMTQTGALYAATVGDWRTCIEIGAPAVEPLIAVLSAWQGSKRKAAANALVAIYQAGKLGSRDRALLLAQRDAITRTHWDLKPSCGDHTDEGIGVEFPI